MTLQSSHTDSAQRNLGFQGRDFDWDSYIRHRPVYSENLYKRIYHYHSSNPLNTFDSVHDVGAGIGTVSENLARQFEHVIVSEPNSEYLKVAAGRLSPALGISEGLRGGDGGRVEEGRFTYLAERAEKSSVASGSVDMVVISEAIHWTDIPSSISEFARQLKSGGTLCIIQYGLIRFLDNDEAQEVWTALFKDVQKITDEWDDAMRGVYFRAGSSMATGFDNVAFPERDWKPGVKRIFTNTGGERRRVGFAIGWGEEEDRVVPADERVSVEEDEDWISEGCDLKWLQGVFASFVPGRKVEEDLERWQEMEKAIGGRNGTVTIAWPNVQILATRI
ncbi:S-adenosyl-L-methionine-dependent methyltransferase [Aspergillus oleicola]